MPGPDLTEQGALPTEIKVRDAVIDAYYSDRVRVGTAARSRAQAAQSIVTIFAGALVATFTFTALGDRPWFTQVSGCVSVGAWLTAALLYVRAVAVPVEGTYGGKRVSLDSGSVIEKLISQADAERSGIDGRQKQANGVSVVALGLTLLTLVLALFGGKKDEEADGALVLTASGQRSVAGLCGMSIDRLEGAVALGTVNAPFIAVIVPKCGSENDVRIFLTKADVAAIYTKEK